MKVELHGKLAAVTGAAAGIGKAVAAAFLETWAAEKIRRVAPRDAGRSPPSSAPWRST